MNCLEFNAESMQIPGWCTIPNGFNWEFGDDVGLICRLININYMRGGRTWFQCPNELLKKEFKKTKYQLNAFFKRMSHIISTRRTGVRYRREISINYAKLSAVNKTELLKFSGQANRTTERVSGQVCLTAHVKRNNKRQRNNSALRASGIGSMSLFEEHESKQTKGTHSTFDLQAAKFLLELLRQKRKLTGPVRIKHWAVEVKRLRKTGHSEKQISDVLKWLEDNLREQYTPLVLNAKNFRLKYDRLVLAMEKAGPPPELISDQARKLANKLSNSTWPKGSNKLLPQAIQQTIDEISNCCRRLKLLSYSLSVESNTSTIQRIIPVLRQQLLSTTFVEQWWLRVHKRVANWSAWDGKLLTFAFKWGTEPADKACADIIAAYTGSTESLAKLKALLEEHIG